MSQQPHSNSDTGSTSPDALSLALLWDYQDCLPLCKSLAEENLVILFTPAIVPLRPELSETSDPFEPLGKALARTHPWIRHVPYIKENGITDTHIAFVRKATVVIFIISGFSPADKAAQLRHAETVQDLCEDIPMVTVTFCDPRGVNFEEHGFSVMVQAPGVSEPELEALAALLMIEDPNPTSRTPSSRSSPGSQGPWSVEHWDYDRDLSEVHTLWTSCMPQKFHLPRPALGQILKRDGFGVHYIVRDSSTRHVVGFCATFTTFADGSSDRFVGSIAALMVKEDFRRQGIGRILHDEVYGRLNKVLGVSRIQLGSTFPRLLHGVPPDLPDKKWFEGRGWIMDESELGKGRLTHDWMMRFDEVPVARFSSAGLTFRSCQQSENSQVLEMASWISERYDYFGWHDQYAKILDGVHESDVIVGFEGKTLVATAITYMPNSGSPVSMDIPFATMAGTNMGGVTCIAIRYDNPDVVSRRDAILNRLFEACRNRLQDREAEGMFVDGIRADERYYRSMGFSQWAEYREVWRQV